MPGSDKARTVLIAGAGIAGLTAALALAAKGFRVRLFERAEALEEFGAGLQVSPNASRILADLGVLDRLMPTAGRPQALRILDAATGKLRTEMPLGEAAARRWGAPYLVAHRADLQAALLAAVGDQQAIEITKGAMATDIRKTGDGVTLSVFGRDGTAVHEGLLLIAADGVWSSLRKKVRSRPDSRFTGHVAWRALVSPQEAAALPGQTGSEAVTAFLHPSFHLVAYPVRAGRMINLVAVIADSALAERWVVEADFSNLREALAASALPPLVDLPSRWTAWPLHEVDHQGPWSGVGGRVVLIGDAAHAMTPFSAQGAAMAIEDAAMLADSLAGGPDNPGDALTRFESERKPRIARVARRGAFNRFTWHASGPVALVRNAVLAARSGPSLMRDFDWLYGFDAGRPT